MCEQGETNGSCHCVPLRVHITLLPAFITVPVCSGVHLFPHLFIQTNEREGVVKRRRRKTPWRGVSPQVEKTYDTLGFLFSPLQGHKSVHF